MLPAIGSAAAGALGVSFLSKKVASSGPSVPAGGKERKPQVEIISLAEEKESNIKNLLIAGSIGAGAMIAIGGIRFISNNEMAERKREEIIRHKEVKDRLRILNRNSKARFNNLDVGIRSEQRAGFRILSNQIQSLSEVAIQTLSEVAKSDARKNTPGKEGEPNEEVTRKTEALLNFARKAQADSDRLSKEETYESAVTFYRTKLRASIGGTPGLQSPSRSTPAQIDNGCTEIDSLDKMKDTRKKRKRRNFYKKIAMVVFGVGIAVVGIHFARSDSRTK